jgi:hypothetical protein
MPIEEEPVVGAVYENEEGRSFEVIAFDVDEGTIEVQYEDETMNEIDIDAWYEMELKRVASLEDEKKSEDDEDDKEDAADDDDEENDEDDFDDDDEEL